MDNIAYSNEEETNERVKKNEPVVIDMPDEDATNCCCSWSGLCDVMGNRQAKFIQILRPMKIPLIDATQRLATLQMELERGMRTTDETIATSRSVHNVIKHINDISSNSVLNVPPDENEMLRHCATDLAVLVRVIDQLRREDEINRLEGRSSPVREVSSAPPSPEPKEEAFVRKGISVRNTAAGSSAVDEHSLKERIDRNKEMLEKLLKFVDKKTERRWWLRDVINFSQLVVKVLLFVSASMAVFYPSDEVFTIITLAITIAQGIIEILDQYFLKNTTPEDIKMHVVTTLSAASSKG